MQSTFKLVVALMVFGFLFQDRINAKEPLAMISLAVILAGFLIGGEWATVKVEKEESKK